MDKKVAKLYVIRLTREQVAKICEALAAQGQFDLAMKVLKQADKGGHK